MSKVTAKDVSVTRTPQGAWECSAIVQEGIYAYLDHSQYYGYTKRQAIALFVERCNKKEKENV